MEFVPFRCYLLPTNLYLLPLIPYISSGFPNRHFLLLPGAAFWHPFASFCFLLQLLCKLFCGLVANPFFDIPCHNIPHFCMRYIATTIFFGTKNCSMVVTFLLI